MSKLNEVVAILITLNKLSLKFRSVQNLIKSQQYLTELKGDAKQRKQSGTINFTAMNFSEQTFEIKFAGYIKPSSYIWAWNRCHLPGVCLGPGDHWKEGEEYPQRNLKQKHANKNIQTVV